MYRFFNWVLDHIFPNRKARDEYLIQTYIKTPWPNDRPSLRYGSRYVFGIYLDLNRRWPAQGPMSIWGSATHNRVTVEEIKAAVAYMRRNPDYLIQELAERKDVSLRGRWKLLTTV